MIPYDNSRPSDIYSVSFLREISIRTPEERSMAKTADFLKTSVIGVSLSCYRWWW
jgi:hypothetical protein